MIEQSELAGDPLVLVDVGGLQGLGPEWEPYVDRIRPIVFEPNPPEAEAIRHLIARSPGGLVIEKALGHCAEVRPLYVTRSRGCTSLMRPNRRLLSRYSIEPAFHIDFTIDVECVRYDSLYAKGDVPAPQAIKVDVQGFELQVLEGFGPLLAGCLAAKIEASVYPIYEGQALLHDYISLFARFGLSLVKLEPVPHFDGDLVEFDAFFACGRERAEGLSKSEARKLELLASAWNLPGRAANFTAAQFGF